jgi:hypothetical protein
MLRKNDQNLRGMLVIVLNEKFVEVGPSFGQKLSKKYLQTLITFRSLNQNASIWAFWKGVVV